MTEDINKLKSQIRVLTENQKSFSMGCLLITESLDRQHTEIVIHRDTLKLLLKAVMKGFSAIDEEIDTINAKLEGHTNDKENGKTKEEDPSFKGFKTKEDNKELLDDLCKKVSAIFN
jgi:hypothetical protein